jgi:hypothetical protein
MLFAILGMAPLLVLLASPVGAQTLTIPLNIDGPRIFVTARVNDKTARLLVVWTVAVGRRVRAPATSP